MKYTKRYVILSALVLTLALLLCTAVSAADTNEVTRAEFLTSLYELSGEHADAAQDVFTDVPEEGSTAAAVNWGASKGIVNGVGGGMFCPDDPVTREQAAAMLYRYAETLGKGFTGMWMFRLEQPDVADVSEYAFGAVHWIVMNDLLDMENGIEPQKHLAKNELIPMLTGALVPLGIDEVWYAFDDVGVALKAPGNMTGVVYSDVLSSFVLKNERVYVAYSLWNQVTIPDSDALNTLAGMATMERTEIVDRDGLPLIKIFARSGVPSYIAMDTYGDAHVLDIAPCYAENGVTIEDAHDEVYAIDGTVCRLTQIPAGSRVITVSIPKSPAPDYLVLVNQHSPVPEDWTENLSLVSAVNSLGDYVEVEREAYKAYLNLKKSLYEEDGVLVYLDSAFRSVEEQQRIMDDFTEKYGEEYARNTVAIPGLSEHHTGLALDLYLNIDGKDIYYNEDMVQYPEFWAKIHAKLADYGFILRYPEGKEDLTGYSYEPWHIRYVGNAAAAHEIMDAGLCFEEWKASGTKEAFSADGSVIFDKDGVRVTTAGMDTDPAFEDGNPIIWLDIENTGDEEVCLGLAYGSVNGFMEQVVFVDYNEESVSYDFDLLLPAHSQKRYALSYYVSQKGSAVLDTIEFCFTTAPDEFVWRDYVSAPVTIKTGIDADEVDIKTIGTVVLDNDTLTIVIGEQDYDDWFGPRISVFVENKTENYIGLYADSAEADGVFCDYFYYGVEIAPGKKCSGTMSFSGEIGEMKGFESLTLCFNFREAEAGDHLDDVDRVALDPVTVTYPPQIWGEYENGGLTLEIQPKYNDLLTVETPQNDPDGILFTVSETASLEAGGHEGAGWLFSIGRISEEKFREMLCWDMSGIEVFAVDDAGNYYVKYHPTDVRYERATVEEMIADADQWTMLCEWAEDAPYQFVDQNGFDSVSYSNTTLSMYLARAAWMDGVNATISTTEFGPLPLAGVDSSPYASYLIRECFFWDVEDEEAPSGEYVVLNFPDDDVRIDFFFAPGGYVRVFSGGTETLYQVVLYGNLTPAAAARGWYYAVAEAAGVKAPDTSLDAFLGSWYEKIAGRGTLTISETLAPDVVTVEARWPDSAAVVHEWTMTAVLGEDGTLVYEDGYETVTEYDEDGYDWIIDQIWDEVGSFSVNDAGELEWRGTDPDSIGGDFLRMQ